MMFATPVFATVINNNSATCDGNTLGVTSGSVRLRAKYAPETINLKWYDSDGNTTTTNTCTYDGGLTLPTQPTKSGYTFKGWRVINYTPIEYIESSGTQWIDTGIKQGTASTYGTEIIYKFINSISDRTSLCGSRKTGYSSWGQLYTNKSYGTGLWASNPNTLVADYIPTTVGTVYTDKFEVDVTNGSVIRTRNGTTQTTTGWTFTPAFPENIFLFAYNAGDNMPGQLASVAIYSTKIWKDGVLVRDFIPVKDSNGVVCMYDKVSGQFFYNQGTGNFIAGPDL